MDSHCNDHPNQPHNQWGAGHPLPLHRQVLPPEPEEGYTLGLWMVYGLAAAVFITFVVMTWVVYPNFPQ